MRVWLPTIRAGTGADVFTERLAAALRARDIEVDITWFPAWYEFLPELMRLHRVPEGTDVIHANGWLALPFVGRGIPVVATVLHLVHDPAYAPHRSFGQTLYHRWHIRWREQRALQGSQAVTAISAYVAGTVRSFCGHANVLAIPNWVDTTRYVPDPGYVPDPARPFRLLMVGNHSRRKGFDLLPGLAVALGPRFALRCTGGLRGVSVATMPGVHMLGRLTEDELVREYQHCDAVISLSRYEGFGYTALEGMACGKPVVAFQTSAVTEVVDDGVTGLLVSVDDVPSFAARCRQLESDRGLARLMGIAGRQRAIEVFGEAAAIGAYLRVYAGLVGWPLISGE
ncbi:glycosyltransferase family 4 protein [Thermomonas sp.]|uniref:glycosyltransferase family 4 protein n=1 Tax=Thermomonas sp. TaxID=1971895 RepID=UPI002489190B|nr:glycosyltransferase family 4 protein [Thermomonas sp.]MDI1254297.1 glycosyltransferase family 4 protein [Thermomonas sp.]